MRLEQVTQEPTGPAKPYDVLFIHGLWHSAWYWQENFMPYFAEKGIRSHAFDLRGHGGSDGKEGLNWVSLSDFVDDLTSVLSGMERTPILVGHSAGGLIIQKYLEKAQAPGAVLMATIPSMGALPTTLRFTARHPVTFLKTNLTLNLRHVVGSFELFKDTMFSDRLPEERLREYYARTQDESYRMFLDMVLLNLPRPKRVKTPMLVVGSDADGFFTPREFEKTAEAYGADYALFEGIGHNMQLDAGWEEVADRIIAWTDAL